MEYVTVMKTINKNLFASFIESTEIILVEYFTTKADFSKAFQSSEGGTVDHVPKIDISRS